MKAAILWDSLLGGWYTSEFSDENVRYFRSGNLEDARLFQPDIVIDSARLIKFTVTISKSSNSSTDSTIKVLTDNEGDLTIDSIISKRGPLSASRAFLTVDNKVYYQMLALGCTKGKF